MKKNHMTEGSVLKSILRIALPVIFANVLITLYQLIDTFWVGRLGANAVASVSLSFPILFFLTSLAMGLAMAGSILIAQYNGKGDYENVSKVAGQTFSIVVIISIIISIIGYFSSNFLLRLFTTDVNVLGPATDYLQISFLAITGMFIYTIFQSSLRGVGEVKIPALIILGTVILNFFLDPLLMFGWKFIPAMGISGVALATLITEYLSAIIGVILMFKGLFHVKLRLKDLIPKLEYIKKIFFLGLPSSLEMSSRSFGMVLMTIVVSGFGTLAIAAFGIGGRILSFVIIPGIGLSIATAAIVGNNLGAGKKERAEEVAFTSMKIGFFFLFSIGIFLFIFAKQVSAFFVPNEPELIIMATQFMKILSLTFGFIGVQMAIGGTLKAAGKTTTSMFLAMLQTFLVVGVSLLLSRFYNVTGIWIAYPIANIITFGVALYFYFNKSWLKTKLVEQ